MTTIEVTILEPDVTISTAPIENVITIEVYEGGIGTTIDYESLPANNLSSQGPTTSAKNAGTTVAVMDCVYLGAAGTWLLADASAESTSKGMLAMALQAKTSGQALKVALPGSFVRNDAWTWATPGAPLYLSTTSGAISDNPPAATDEAVRVVAWVVTADVIYFNPSGDYITLN